MVCIAGKLYQSADIFKYDSEYMEASKSNISIVTDV